MGRVVSDIESEKRTRAAVNNTLHEKLDKINEHQSKQDRIVYIGLGIVVTLQFASQYILAR